MMTQAAGPCALFTLLIVAALTYAKMMDMSTKAVDDQFISCERHMMEKVMGPGGLLEKELKGSEEFRTSWKNTTQGKGNLTKQHIQALETYSSEGFRKMFNEAVEQQGWNISTYRRSFPYKSFHFLLTDALRLLRQGCHTVYRGSSTEYDAKVGSKVRFGRFTAVANKKSDVEELATDGTIFIIKSCSAVEIKDYASKHNDISWLVAPFEVFNVTRVSDDNEEKEITLDHHSFYSNHNCSMFRDLEPSGRAVTFSPPLTLCLCASLWVTTKLFI